MRAPLLWILALTIAGCASKTATNPAAPAPEPDAKLVLSMDGPGGTVSIGDDLVAAKKAFPAIKGAQVFDAPIGLGMFWKEGWGWNAENNSESFEVAVKNGKIVAMATMAQNLSRGENELKDAIAKFGKPTRKAEGKVASLYVWETGTNARFFLRMSDKVAFSQAGCGWMIGPTEDMKMLNMRADDPGIMIRQFDAAAERMKSGEASEVFKRAKEKAQAKMKAEKAKAGK